MRASTRRFSPRWLALGPAAFSLIAASGVVQAQDKAQLSAVHRQVSAAEVSVAKAISASDSKNLFRIGNELGRIIEAALERRENGGEVSSCEMAAHSLAFVAVSASDGFASKGEPRKALLEDAASASSDFRKDMLACDKQAGQKTGSHTSVDKALRAL
jgi:hypothetical protein